ncbi:MAG: non-heme iron oxygenase ferredoxin subunit [Actinomycetota bacterium]
MGERGGAREGYRSAPPHIDFGGGHMSEFVKVGASEDLAEGEARSFEVGDQVVGVARVGGDLLAFSDVCTHQQCSLTADGDVEGTVIECGCHGSRFDMKTGAVLAGPATEPIAVFGVRDEGGNLQLTV